MKCTKCNLKGAALGCYVKSCRRSYHVPCAREISRCRWDHVCFATFFTFSSAYIVINYLPRFQFQSESFAFSLQEDFLLLCPVHSSVKFPNEKSRHRTSRAEPLPKMYQISFSIFLIRLFIFHMILTNNPITFSLRNPAELCSLDKKPDTTRDLVICGSALSQGDKVSTYY